MSDDRPRPEPGATAPLRFAVLTPGYALERWQVEALRRLPRSVASPALCICVDAERVPEERSRAGHSALARSYRARRLRRPGRALEMRPLHPVMDDVPTTWAVPIREDRGRPALPHDGLARIADAGCDFVVDFSDVGVAGLDRETVPHGLWRFRLPHRPVSDGDGVDGPEPDADLFEVSLVRVGAGRQADVLLHSGCFRAVRHSLAATIDSGLFGSVEWLRRTCRQLAHDGELTTRPSSPSEGLLAHIGARAFARSSLHKVRRVAGAVLWQEQWHVGVAEQSIVDLYRSGDLGRVRWLRAPSKRHYIADPFGVAADDTILVEAFDHVTRRGHIAALDLGSSSADLDMRAVLRTSGHMSYPYLLADGGELYCIPETCDRRQVVLHRAIGFPDRWETTAVLVDGFAAADATVVRHDGRWWMFCIDDELGPETNLHIFHAPELRGPWSPHLLNPVKTDVRSSRPGGTPFVVDGTLIRPAQDGSRGYGGRLVLNAVRTLTPTAFEETAVAGLTPDGHSRYRHGIHTLSSWGDRTLVDGKMKRASAMGVIGHARARLPARFVTRAHEPTAPDATADEDDDDR